MMPLSTKMSGLRPLASENELNVYLNIGIAIVDFDVRIAPLYLIVLLFTKMSGLTPLKDST